MKISSESWKIYSAVPQNFKGKERDPAENFGIGYSSAFCRICFLDAAKQTEIMKTNTHKT